VSLSEYRRKRDFTRTREPAPRKSPAAAERPIFVVQLHHASRRHYDFRLQVGDTLKSWAVPKGPSFDPKVKRLAAQVEDHPLDYASFEGDIPQGEYGGGHVARFDQGIWSSDGDVAFQLAKGHLKFELFGEKLKGGWHLVRTARRARQPEWLLFKQDDEFAGPLEADQMLDDVPAPPASSPKRAKAIAMRKEAQTATARRSTTSRSETALDRARKSRLAEKPFAPQLATLGSAPPDGAQWLHELKWDGYRLLTVIRGGRARLWSRNVIEWTDKVPEIVTALQQLGLDDAAFDGELIAGQGGQADFGLLQSTLSGEKQARLTYMVFDVLHLAGVALDRAPLLQRKQLLERVLANAPKHLGYSSHWIDDGPTALEVATQRDFEGIISKRIDRSYHPGRSTEWLKSKRVHSDEYAVVGFTAPKRSREGFGSLLLARPDARHGWKYAGRVGSGFSDEQLRELRERLGAGKIEPSVHVEATDTDLRSARWFAPKFVVEVFARGFGTHGLLRQPSLKAIRMDKKVSDLLDSDAPRKTAAPRRKSAVKKVAAKVVKGTAKAPAAGRKRGGATSDVDVPAAAKAAGKARGAKVVATRITHPERVVYPADGITKQQVADYYSAIAPRLLKEIAGRPLSIVRCPDGIANACFFQKHVTGGMNRVDSIKLKEESGKQANYLVVNDEAALMELVQFNALEFHPWGSFAKRPERADRVVFDLDPGPGVAWPDVRKAARDLRDRLAQLDLVSYLRTSGGKGLHVVVPLNPGCDWDLVKRFARGFAETLAQTQPKQYVSVSTLSKRPGKIFIDYLRNGRGATSVASYSLRARAGAPVAVPLAWSELARLPRSNAFDPDSTLRRVARMKDDPWADIDDIRQNLARWSRSAS
jgi:bifunctional non-homologous end joining protein LigD